MTHPVDLVCECREVAQALAAVADLCIPASNDPCEASRHITAAQVGPVIDILIRALLGRLDALDQALSAAQPG